MIDMLPREIFDNIISLIPRRIGEENGPRWKTRFLPPIFPALSSCRVIGRSYQSSSGMAHLTLSVPRCGH